MAVLKSLKLKDKNFIFKSFGNNESGNPAKIIFNRYPLPDETYPVATAKNVYDNSIFKNFDNTQQAKERLIQMVVDNLINNISANRIDYLKFFNECVSHIENLEYDGKIIKSINDFFQLLPEEAWYTIAQEAYLYAKENDTFTISEKKI